MMHGNVRYCLHHHRSRHDLQQCRQGNNSVKQVQVLCIPSDTLLLEAVNHFFLLYNKVTHQLVTVLLPEDSDMVANSSHSPCSSNTTRSSSESSSLANLKVFRLFTDIIVRESGHHVRKLLRRLTRGRGGRLLDAWEIRHCSEETKARAIKFRIIIRL